MLKSIRELGRLILTKYAKEGLSERDAFLRTQVKREKPREGDILIKIIFSLDTREIKFDYQKFNKSVRETYLWVGNDPGNEPQVRLTTDKVDYIIGNFSKKRNKWAIGEFIERAEEGGLGEDEDVKKLRELLLEVEENFFEKGNILEMEEKAKEEVKRFGGREVGFFTVLIEKGGVSVDVTDEGYKKLLENDLLKIKGLRKGMCHVCCDRKDVTADPAYPPRSILKVYSIDKVGFTSGVEDSDEARIRTHAVCIDCLHELHSGAMFIEKAFRFPMNTFNAYLIPKSLVEIRKELFEKWVEYSSGIFGAVKSYEEMTKFEEKLKKYAKHREREGTYYLDILFCGKEGAGSEFDFKCIVEGVPFTRLTEIRKEGRKWGNKMVDVLGGEKPDWILTFSLIDRIFPLRVSVRRGRRIVTEWKPLATLYSSMLKGTPYPLPLLFRKALKLVRIHRYGTYELYDIYYLYGRKVPDKPKEKDRWLVRDLLRFNVLLKLLEKLKVIRMEGFCKSMSNDVFNKKELPNDIREWFEIMDYNEWQKALFLLGALVAKIGTEQYKRGDEKKAILNKIDFDGMSTERVMMLANQVLKSLRDYRILSGNEKLYGQMKILLDANLNKTSNNLMNTFYTLSGYSFITYKIITGGEPNEL